MVDWNAAETLLEQLEKLPTAESTLSNFFVSGLLR